MQEQQTLLKQTRDYVRFGQLIAPGQHILAAVSGGRDSCVMLHILHALRQELGFLLSVAHFDHGLREASHKEQQFVRQLAAVYGLPFHAGAADVRTLAGGGNIEAAARNARYAFLRRTAGQVGAQFIATAHHAQDQAETLLLHLLRGCGLEGLAAIAPLEGDVLRPLLFALPTQIEEYRVMENLDFCQDESNADTQYLRNHLRINILPQLLALNPRLLTATSATADICREDNTLLDKLAYDGLQRLWLPGQRALDAGFYALPPALRRRVLRLAVEHVAGRDNALSYTQTAAALKLKEEQSLSIGGGWLIYRRGSLYIDREQPPLPLYEDIIQVIVDGNWYKLAAWGWEYRADYAPVGPAGPTGPTGITDITLPAPMAEKLVFRTRRAGDAVPSRGREGRRKLKDIFIAARIPQHQRAAWPLLLYGEDIVWVPRLYCRELAPTDQTIIISAREISE